MISVIIPAYNVEDYIAECLDSVLNQTYKDLEIIIVDDGSTDKTPQILMDYAQKDPRIRVLKQQNSGQSCARNRGIREAKGEYIIFVDSDDWMSSDNIFKRFLDLIMSSNSDYVQGGMCFLKSGQITKEYIPPHQHVLTGDSILEAAINLNGLYTGPIAKIYRTDFLKSNNLYFLEGLVNEDTAHSIMIAACASKVGFINDITYNIREREDSTSRADFKRMFRTMHEVMRQTRESLKEMGKYERVSRIFEGRYLRSMLYNLLQSAQRTEYARFKEDWDYCMAETDYRKNKAFAQYLPTAHRAMYHLSKWPRGFYHGFRSLNRLGIKMH